MEVFILIVLFVVNIFSISNIIDILDPKKAENTALHGVIYTAICLAITVITIAYDVILMYLLIKGI